MAVKLVFDEKKLARTTLARNRSARLEFTPQEGPIEATAFAAPATPAPKPRKPGSSGPGGKIDPNPDRGGDGPGVPPLSDQIGDAEVRVELFPPGATKPQISKTFRLKDLDDNKPPVPLKLGVRPDEAGKSWSAAFRNTGDTAAKVSGTIRFVKERVEDAPPPAEVSINSRASLPVTRLRPADGAILQFKPTAGMIEVAVFGAEVKPGPSTGKPDPDPDRGDGIGVSVKQNVRLHVDLSAPGSGIVASGDYRSRELLTDEAQEPVVRHTVPADTANEVWQCRVTNRGKTDVMCAASVRFLIPSLRTDIPLEVLNHGLRQLINGIALTVRIDGTKAVIGVSEELEKFASEALGGSLSIDVDLPAEFSDFNLYTIAARARTVRGRPTISMHAAFEAGGEEVHDFKKLVRPPRGLLLPPQIELPGVPVPADVDIARLAITVEVELRTVDSKGRRILQPSTKVDVDVSAFAEVFSFFGMDVSDSVRDELVGRIRALVDSPKFKSTVGIYLTEGVIALAAQGHEFQELRADADGFIVLHVNPEPKAPAQPPQPNEIDFPRPASLEPKALDDESRRALAKIDHVVVLMQENRSFDHLLGYLSHPDHGLPILESTPGRDVPEGLRGGESNPRIPGRPVIIQPYGTGSVNIGLNSFIHATGVPFSPHHEHEHVVEQINDGAMDGFVNDFVSRFPSADPQFAMSFYTGAHLPVFDALGGRFAICDRWFCSHPGPTQPNRFCTLSGHTPVLDNFPISDPIYGYLRMPTMFELLTEAGVDWGYYEGDIGFLRMYDRYRLDGKHLRPLAQFFKDAALGQLPRVAFVDPNFADVPPAATANDDHAPADVSFGQALIGMIHDAVVTSPRWVTSDGTAGAMLVITYDEHGGFFDHVPPPGTPRSEQPEPVPLVHPRSKSFYGPRVPAFAISPFVRPGRVDHTIYDHTSIMATILHRFVGEIPRQLGPRVAVANHLGGLLELDEPRRPGALPRQPAPTIDRRFRPMRRELGEFHAGMRALAQPRRA